MPAASDLDEAANFALQNVWERFNASDVLRAQFEIWLLAFGSLDLSDADQERISFWLAPSTFVICNLPTAAVDQTTQQVENVVDVLSRTLDFMRNTTLTGAQQTAIVDQYNTAWA